LVVWITALPTHSSQRSVASAINPNAASAANSGSARRLKVRCEAGFGDRALAAAAAPGEDGIVPV
jgi:hypothetical protein